MGPLIASFPLEEARLHQPFRWRLSSAEAALIKGWRKAGRFDLEPEFGFLCPRVRRIDPTLYQPLVIER